MTSQDFIRAEADNTDRIILYKEGLFWKAYERSAYILCMQVRPFKPTKKSLKSLDGGCIVSVGFPWKHEEKHIGTLKRLENSDDRLTLAAASPIDTADFEAWKALLPLHVPAVRQTADGAVTTPAGADAGGGDVTAIHATTPAATYVKNYAGTSSATTYVKGGVEATPAVTYVRSYAATSVADPFAPVVAAPPESPRRAEHTSRIVACTPDGSSLSETGRDTSDNKLPLPTERMADFTLTTACAVAERIRQFNLAESTPMECMLFISELKKTLQTTS